MTSLNGYSKYWKITDNVEYDKSEWLAWATTKGTSAGLTYLVIKREQAPSTGKIHGQGFSAFQSRMRWRQIKKLLPDGVHFETMRAEDTVSSCVNYVKKDRTTVPEEDGGWLLEWGKEPESQQGKRNDWETIREMVRDGKEWVDIVDVVPRAMQYKNFIDSYRAGLSEKKMVSMEEIQLRPWQEDLMHALKGPVLPRRIFWIWSPHSNVGKTTFFRYINNNRILPMLSVTGAHDISNIIFAYNEQPIIWFDLSRNSVLDYKIFNILETLSNCGPVFSPKYVSMQKSVSSHICVTSNFPPPLRELPKRIEQIELDENGQRIQKDSYDPLEMVPQRWIEANE